MNKNHVMLRLFNSFEENNIMYLHFKSNTNLSDSFQGKADFDVLVDKRRIDTIENIIISLHGKRHNPVHIGSYPGVDNWLIFDENTGVVFHLHLHYQLVTGKSLVKDYVIPWDALLFSTRIKDPIYQIFVTDPNLELILLAVRSVVKAKPKEYVKKILGFYQLNPSMRREWDDLKEKSSNEKIEEYLNILFPNKATSILECLSNHSLKSFPYYSLHRTIRKEVRLYRRYSGLEATLRAWIYRLEDLVHKIWSRKMGGISITKKVSLQGGLIIAFVGVDGAGKSTVSNEICKWIGKKIECKRFYMGIGDGKTTLLSSLLKLIYGKIHPNKKQILDSDRKKNNMPSDNISSSYIEKRSFFSYVKSYMKLLQIMSVEKNNLKKIKHMHRYRLNGGISVLDRFPQVEIAGQNDGPKVPNLIKSFGNGKFIKRRISKEMEYLGIVRTIKPDLVFRLKISPETCLSRKPEHINYAVHQRKIEELNKLNYQGANIIEIDAEQPFEDELLEIKRILWKYV